MSLSPCCPHRVGGNKVESKRLSQGQGKGGKSGEMVTGPEEDVGILSGRNGISNNMGRGYAGVHRLRSTAGRKLA